MLRWSFYPESWTEARRWLLVAVLFVVGGVTLAALGGTGLLTLLLLGFLVVGIVGFLALLAVAALR